MIQLPDVTFKSPEYSLWWVGLKKAWLVSVCTRGCVISYLEHKAFDGPSIHGQDNVTSCDGPVLLSRLPWEESLNSHKIILEMAAALSLHLHEAESQPTGIFFQGDFKLRTCVVGYGQDKSLSTFPLKLTGLYNDVHCQVNELFLFYKKISFC